MTTSNFNLFTAKVLSMGVLSIELDEITDISADITGTTADNANLQAVYNTTTLTGTADSNGDIAFAIPSPIAVGTTILFTSNWNFLTVTISITTDGSVSFETLPDLQFYGIAVPYNNTYVYRLDPNWSMSLLDTRTDSAEWYLYASITAPLSSGGCTLDNALIFVDEEDNITPLSAAPLLIATGTGSAVISWKALKGLLLEVAPTELYPVGNYSTLIDWKITLSPL